MAVSTGDILRVVATMLWTDGNVMQNVFNALITGGGGPWPDEDVVDDCNDWMDAVYANLTANTVNTLDGSQTHTYKYDTVGEDWDEVGSSNWGWNPAEINEELPRGCSGLLNLRTVDPDVNGKKYFGGQSENSCAAGLWTGGMLAAFVLAGGDWILDFVGAATGADFDPGVWSPTEEAFFGASDTIVIPTMAAYQRRRKRGVGI